MMPPVASVPISVSSRAMTVVLISAVETAVFMRRYRLAPNSWETSTLVPMFTPVATATNSWVIG